MYLLVGGHGNILLANAFQRLKKNYSEFNYSINVTNNNIKSGISCYVDNRDNSSYMKIGSYIFNEELSNIKKGGRVPLMLYAT